MIVHQIDNDSEVIDLASSRKVYSDFLRIQAEALHNSGGGFWVVTDREPGRIYLFVGFIGHELSESNGYFCLVVDYDTSEAEQAIIYINSMILTLIKRYDSQTL